LSAEASVQHEYFARPKDAVVFRICKAAALCEPVRISEYFHNVDRDRTLAVTLGEHLFLRVGVDGSLEMADGMSVDALRCLIKRTPLQNIALSIPRGQGIERRNGKSRKTKMVWAVFLGIGIGL